MAQTQPRTLSKPLALCAGLLILVGTGLTLWVLADTPRPAAAATPTPAVEAALATPRPPPPLPRLGPAAARRAQAGDAPRPSEVRPATPLAAALGDPSAPRRLVVDVAALLRTQPIQVALRCLPRMDRRALENMRALGFEPLTDLNTVAVIGEVAVLEGRFDAIDWAALDGAFEGERISPNTLLYQGDGAAFALWKGQLVIAHRDREAVLAVLARVEGDDPSGPAPTPRGMAYGQIPAEDLFEVLPIDRQVARPLAALLTDEGAGLAFSVDADDDGLTIDAHLAEGGPIAAQALASAFETAKAGGLRGVPAPMGEAIQALSVRAQGAAVGARLPLSVHTLAALLGDCARTGELP